MADIGSPALAADPRLKARLYEELGVEVTYDARHRTLSGSVCRRTCRRGVRNLSTPEPWEMARAV